MIDDLSEITKFLGQEYSVFILKAKGEPLWNTVQRSDCSLVFRNQAAQNSSVESLSQISASTT